MSKDALLQEMAAEYTFSAVVFASKKAYMDSGVTFPQMEGDFKRVLGDEVALIMPEDLEGERRAGALRDQIEGAEVVLQGRRSLPQDASYKSQVIGAI